MAKPINLSNVNISLQEFQEIASGKYNAGEVKLAGENRLGKMNNHVETWWFSNREKIDHEEVLAIKQAFVKALSKNGVGEAEINRIRQELGLAPLGADDRGLRRRNVVPLARQQIREILDRNAAVINSQPLANAVRINDSSMIYGPSGMSDEAKAKRDAVNRELASGKRSVREVKSFGRFETVITGSVGYARPEARRAMLGIAREQLGMLMRQCECRPSATVPAAAMFPVPGGPSIEMPTGLSQKAFAERLENVIVLLDGRSGPDPAEVELFRGFRDLGSVEAKGAYLDGLANDPQGGMKARSIAVQSLYRLGVADHATLSLANRLGDADAVALAKAVLALGEDATPEAVRADAVVAALAAKAPAEVPDRGKVYVPAVSAGEFNEYVRVAIDSHPEKALPGFGVLTAEISNIVRSRLGEKGLPDGSKLTWLVGTHDLGPILDTGPDAVRITPDTLREPLLRAALLTGATRMVDGAAEEEFAAAGRADASGGWVVAGVCARHPELLERLAAAESPAAASGILEEYRGAIRETVALRIAVGDVCKGVEGRARAAVADLFGLPPGAADAADIRFDRLVRKANDLRDGIVKGEKGPMTQEQIEKAFQDLVDEHAAALASRFADVDKLQLPQDRKDAIKVALLELFKVQGIDIGRLAGEVAKIDAGPLDDLLQSPDAKPVDVFNAMKPLSAAFRSAINAMFEGQERPGPDDCDGMTMIMTQMLAGSRPGLAQRLEAFYERPDVVDAVKNRDFFDRDDPAAASVPFEIVSTNPAVNRYAPAHDGIRRNLVVAGREMAQYPQFRDAGGIDRAAAAGYHATEMPALARAFAMCQAATGCSDADALAAALDPTSKTRRLLDYGGRFAGSAENFREGLRLMDLFHQWYPQVVADAEADKRDTVTTLTFNQTVARPSAERAVEKFLFEQIAIDPSLRLDEQDPEKIFGMENNKALRFVGRGYTTSAAATVAAVPPDKRDLLYDVFDALHPLSRTAEEAKAATYIGTGPLLISRVLRNYDALAALRAQGLLDREHLVPLLYGDLGVTAAHDNRQINDVLGEKQMARMDIAYPLMVMMNETGETLDACLAAIQEGRRLPSAPYVTSGTGHLEELDGTADGGRRTLIGDLIRPTNAKYTDGGPVMKQEDTRFTFRFPDGNTLVAKIGDLGKKEVSQSCTAIADRIEQLCGKVHPKQLSAIYFALSQSGTGMNTKDGFRSRGIESDEHMALTFALSRDAATGSVTITCTEPQGFPFHFHWTTTVTLSGTVTTTPMVIEE